MSREIKFRAWDGKGMFQASTIACDGEGAYVITGEFEGKPTGKYLGGKWAEPLIALMQYTGLKDKNGVEIYEGDIAKGGTFGICAVVEFCTEDVGSCGCCLPEFQGSGFKAYEINLSDCEVIGNIYENPELVSA